MFLVEIQTPDDSVGAIYQTLTQRRGIVISEDPIAGTPLVQMKAHMPVGESFGFTQALRAATSGRAFPQCVFDHWEEMSGNPLEEGSKANVLVESIRKRKGLKPGVPALDNFVDKL
jgi:elongation factor 2